MRICKAHKLAQTDLIINRGNNLRIHVALVNPHYPDDVAQVVFIQLASVIGGSA